MTNVRIDIKALTTGAVLFSHEAEDNTIRITMEAAVSAGANLSRADLAGADLLGANLTGAENRGPKDAV